MLEVSKHAKNCLKMSGELVLFFVVHFVYLEIYNYHFIHINVNLTLHSLPFISLTKKSIDLPVPV